MHGPSEKRRDPADRFVLRTLGGASLSVVHADGTSEIILRPSKPLAVLLYLALSPGHTASRDQLVDLLWFHQERPQALSGLRVALNTLRRELGADVLGVDEDPVTLDVRIETDRDAFADAWKRRDFETVVKVYDGHFFPDFATPGGAAFEQWADAERARLRRMFRQAATEVVHTGLSKARTHDAEMLASRVRDLDRDDEYAWHLLFECLIASRNDLRAAVEAAELERMLAADDSEPDPTTRSLLQRLRAVTHDNAAGAASRPPLTVELVGREREFSTILQAWEHACGGRATHVHVAAPAGLGKTRLLHDVRARLRAADARVVHVTANQGARDLAYALASDIAGALATRRGAGGVPAGVASALVALNPTLSEIFRVTPDPAVGEEALRRREVALRELVSAVADEKPFALVIDDLHWSDPLSLRLLDAMLPSLERTPVLVLSAARHTRDDRQVAPRALQVALEPLTTDDVTAMVSSIAPLPEEPWAVHLPSALYSATGGSPLLVLETLQLLRERELLVSTPEGWTLHGTADALFGALGERSALRRRVEGLDGVQRSVLLLLAVTGVPVSEDQLREAADSVGDFGASLVALEQRGLVAVHSREWSTAHDEHAAAIMNVASDDEVRFAAAAMGRAIADDAGRNPRQLRLAALLLARGNDVAALSRLFVRFEIAMRNEGDVRSARALAHDLLGSAATVGLEESLVRALPWHLRTRLRSSRRAAPVTAIAAISLSVALAAMGIGSRPHYAPEETLLLQRQSRDGTMREFSEVPLDAQRLASTAPIDINVTASAKWHIPDSVWRYVQGSTPRPDRTGWAVTRAVPDSGVLDVFDVRLDGSARRLTWARLDDLAGGWSPDNRQLAFLTMRWSSHGHYDVAVYDTLTHDVRRLTGPHDDTDVGPLWSPDGSRIAFVRHYSATGEVRLCVIDADGANLHCLPTNRGGNGGVLGWADAHRVFMGLPQPSGIDLTRVDVDSGDEMLVRSNANDARVSPDGRYVLCTCERRGYPAGTRFMFAVDAPEELAVVRYAPPGAQDEGALSLSWSPTSPIRPYVARLRTLGGPGRAVAGFPYQLRASGIDTAGHPVDVGVVRWRSLDTTIAIVDPSGMLRARRAGRVTVEASAGGWRSEKSMITVVASSEPNAVLDEQWSGNLEPVWVRFGQPQPTIVRSDFFGSALSTNGDGSFWSGVYTARTFDARGGLWVEAELSVPLTEPGPSQEQLVALFAVRDSVRWKTWDRVTGDHPPVPSCRIRYPVGSDHSSAGDSLIIDAAAAGAQIFRVPRPLRSGQPFKAVVQILPDGRCAFAIDGRALFISQPAYFDANAQLMLVGNTQETHALVGRVRVYTGIAPFMSWDER